MSGKDIEKWADEFMFEAESISVSDGPKVYLLSANNDPLGSIAAAAKAYKGEFVESLAEVTDEERRYYLEQIQKTALAMPLESVNFQFRITGVTRGFTHQLVRQRTAAYSQESTRFAVKSGVPVGLPPSLKDTNSVNERAVALHEKFPMWPMDDCLQLAKDSVGVAHWRDKWDEAVEKVAEVYNYLVNDGMPAEDARGLLPTNLLTQVNYHTSLRGLQDHSGLRLCTQAQFEWREVWMQIVSSIQQYGRYVSYEVEVDGVDPAASYERISEDVARRGSAWQFEALASIFKPICYQKGSCQFGADFDRKCSIRERVERFAEHGIPSSHWGEGVQVMDHDGLPSQLLPIYPVEFMYDDGAAR